MAVTAVIRLALQEDWLRIQALLSTEGLPTSDLDRRSTADFSVAVDAGEIVGAVAVERYGGHGLLRSLVVDKAWRGRGLGQALVSAAEFAATGERIRSLTLLTQSAAPFFQSLGYQEIHRNDAPPAIKSSAEFSQLCPSSSICMTKTMVVNVQ